MSRYIFKVLVEGNRIMWEGLKLASQSLKNQKAFISIQVQNTTIQKFGVGKIFHLFLYFFVKDECFHCAQTHQIDKK